MKSKIIILFTLLIFQTITAQIYVSKAVKIATRNDAYPYGEAKEANVDVILDLEHRQLKVSNINDYCFDLQVTSETIRDNKKVLRLSSTCPENKKCFVIACIENNQIVNLEIKFLSTSYMYYLASL